MNRRIATRLATLEAKQIPPEPPHLFLGMHDQQPHLPITGYANYERTVFVAREDGERLGALQRRACRLHPSQFWIPMHAEAPCDAN